MRIAHLSDLHILALDGVGIGRFLSKRLVGGAGLLLHRRGAYPWELAEAAIRDVNAQRVDHVVITGDLTNLSLEPEFARARALLELLELSPEQISLIPGNHDVYTQGAERVRRFERFLSPYVRGDEPGADVYPYLRLRGEVAIIGLSTAVATPPLFASGRVGRAQLDALAVLLSRPEVRSRFTLVMLHHPPIAGIASSPLRRLDDAAAFRSVIARTRVGLLLYGHEHDPHSGAIPSEAGSTPYFCAGSTTRLSRNPGRTGRYNIYTIREGRLALVETRAYDRHRRAFA